MCTQVWLILILISVTEYNIYRMLFLALKKVLLVKIPPHQIPTIQLKNAHAAKFLITLLLRESPPPKKKTIWKTLCIAYINVNIALNSHTYK